MLDVEKLVVLRAVIAHGSIAAAARELGYTRSAVSQQMSALERTAGVTLLVRSGNAVSVTPAGRRLLEHTERILVEVRAAESSLRQAKGAITGALRIGIPFREGPATMSSALTVVRRRHPQLTLTLAATTDERGPVELRHGRLDVVLLSRYDRVDPEEGLREWTVAHDPLRLCVPADHRLADAARCTLAELADEEWVLNPHSALGRLTLGLCAAAGFRPTVAAAVDDVATALGLTAVGWGVTIAPERTPIGPGQTVRRIPVDGVEAQRQSVLLVRDGDQDSPEIAAVVAAVRKVAARA